jgi:hypothetical protein
VDLRAAEARARLARVALVCVGVAAAVVLPVAALDPRAFWADIVVYNLGLPGGQNYPLGGTPGFGFANFLIYAGRVSSLRQDVPLGLSALILVPLGLLCCAARCGTAPRPVRSSAGAPCSWPRSISPAWCMRTI